MLNIFTVIFTTLIVPRFARLPHLKGTIIARFLVLQLGLFVIGLIIVLAAHIFSPQILWILGRRFAGLHKELVLVAVQTCIGLISTSTNQLLSSRGIIVPPVLFIMFAIAAQIGFAFAVPLNQVAGVLWYGILTGAVIYLTRIVYFGITIANHEII
jgi:hypothetical protein